LRPELVNQDLDARLELVVASSIEIVDAHDGFEITDQLVLGQEVAHRDADDGRSALAAPDYHFPTALVLVIEMKPKSDVMHLDGGAIMRRTGDCDLELARQKRKLRMKARPLANQFGDRTRIGKLIGRRTRPVVGRDIADAVARGLDGMHLDFR